MMKLIYLLLHFLLGLKLNYIEIHLKDPNLWDPTDPFLYKLTTFIKRDSKILDSYNLNVGIRTIKVINNQILLNDKPIELKGFGRHEDSSVTGRGQNLPQSIKDHNLLKWTGANSYRTSHYPYSQEDLELADKNGFLVIGEIPAVGLFFDDDSDEIQVRLEKCRQQIDELIDRDKNHPSVIMWSVANEPFPPDLMNRMQSSSEEPVNPISTLSAFRQLLTTYSKCGKFNLCRVGFIVVGICQSKICIQLLKILGLLEAV